MLLFNLCLFLCAICSVTSLLKYNVLPTAEMDCCEWASVPAVPILIQPGCHTLSCCLGPARARAAGLSAAAVNYGCTEPDQEYRSSSPADKRCIALAAGLEVGWRRSKYSDASNSWHGQLRWPHGKDSGGHVQGVSRGRTKMGAARKPREFGKFNGGVSHGCGHSKEHQCHQSDLLSNALSAGAKKKKNASSPLLFAAAVGIQYGPLFAL